MKTAISIPDKTFKKAEHLARVSKKSRSELYVKAIEEYLARHAPEDVTDAYDKVAREVGAEPDAFIAAAAHRILKRSEW